MARHSINTTYWKSSMYSSTSHRIHNCMVGCYSEPVSEQTAKSQEINKQNILKNGRWQYLYYAYYIMKEKYVVFVTVCIIR